eukprot:CAMPEP_0117747312 /NCGR_PEP_ID=MMETSP0947-20121206/8433_1 /TAXON_ID=44440 /ORGANISM="Chattonella subsalsa, Strain CCMP2191" /LENGTH=199 /DNA_ID=CAMNT_0005564735 /DNA_START=34 /DNA_END=633 /DNA_ORIENTATION=+
MGNQAVSSQLCPCASSLTEHYRKGQIYSFLQKGEVFSKQAKTFSLFTRQPDKINVYLDEECKALRWEAVDKASKTKGEIELLSMRKIEKKDSLSLCLVGSCGDLLLELEAAETEIRDEWADALEEAVGYSKTSGEKEKPKSAVDSMKEKAKKEMYFQKKDLELRKNKRDKEKRKAELMKQVGGGLKYTAVAMATMGDRS